MPTAEEYTALTIAHDKGDHGYSYKDCSLCVKRAEQQKRERERGDD